MLALPPQTMPISRGVVLARSAATDGVLASQSRCSHLQGPAQSLCYAALYGVYS
jgi:hypothetical protein